ncbi:CAP domain-containing protein [Bacillus marinisedimentorum]|uniref:CAP domain-containing protein n=1 Tax=Bacillus marinisedimentorum TaxID=1821260 RepID=UPI000871D497|nr:CAP domain-containing protein [Bacillus marinisedimentorum]
MNQDDSRQIDFQIESGEAVLDHKEDKDPGKIANLGLLIGKTEQEVKHIMGEHVRTEPSAYGYEWRIFDRPGQYVMVGIENGKAVTAFATGNDAPVKPFKIGQSAVEIRETAARQTENSFSVNGTEYQFHLTENDLKAKPLLQIAPDVWVQLYIDIFTGSLSSVRYLNDGTLVKHRPYEMAYRGKLAENPQLDFGTWAEVEKGEAKQIFDLTNVIRKRHGLGEVKWSPETARVAYLHSKDMHVNEYFSHQSLDDKDLGDRLTAGGVAFQLAGENIAAQYTDAIDAVEGWLNSEGHRKTLLNGDFTHLGTGVYQLYYTQNFIQDWQ